MNSERYLSCAGHSQSELASWQARAVAAVAGVALVGVFVATYGCGRMAQAAAARADAIEIEAEDQAFCARLGLPSRSDAYGRCTLGLGEIRRLHQGRWNAKAVGIL
jgi:hypothetical protein